MARLVSFVLFLVFANEAGSGYANRWGFTPVDWVCAHVIPATPIKVRGFDLILLGVLLAASLKRDKRALVAPMKSALFLTLATTVLWFLYGVARGGDAGAAGWQTYLLLSTVLVAFAVAAAFKTVADFEELAKWLVAASVYHAIMCWLSYFTWAREMVGGLGLFVTTHDDTIPWVISVLVLTVDAIAKKSKGIALRNTLLIFVIVGAIQWNSRRIAWVSLALGLLVLYVLFPHGAARVRVKRVARIAAPLVLIYVVVGWGRQNKIFLPLRSISSVSNEEDSSTLARNAENLGLIATANASSAMLGTGWGHPYIVLTMAYDISGFKLWRYMPHNSILMLLAFTGAVGFAGFWLALPTSVFLNARTARFTRDPNARSVAIVGAAQIIVCGVQLYGDMGIFSPQTMYAIAVSQAIALRLPIIAGTWNPQKAKSAALGR